MNLRPRRLRGQLLLANLIVAGATLGTLLLGVSLIGPGYFQEAMGHRPSDPAAEAMDALTLLAFQEATRTALLAAAITALSGAVAVSLALSGRIAGPVSRLAAAARRIASGHYAERVPAGGDGEVEELASAFNQMGSSLEATERRRLQLVGDVAHELRTPLTTLDGYLEGLQDGVIEPTPDTWALLRGETNRMTRLIGDLGDLWRAEAHQLPIHLEVVEVMGVLAEAAQRHAAQAEARGIEIRVAPREALAAHTDRDRLTQVIGNYLSNALRYAPEHSVVTLSARRDGGEVRIGVTDEGPGLTADQLARLFERFYRPDPSRSRALGGAGIGLAIARALAEAMGGRAWAESEGPGHPSTFLVGIPARLTDS